MNSLSIIQLFPQCKHTGTDTQTHTLAHAQFIKPEHLDNKISQRSLVWSHLQPSHILYTKAAALYTYIPSGKPVAPALRVSPTADKLKVENCDFPQNYHDFGAATGNSTSASRSATRKLTEGVSRRVFITNTSTFVSCTHPFWLTSVVMRRGWYMI